MSTRNTSEHISNDEYEDEEDACEETVLAADTGTVTFRDYGDGNVWLGLRDENDPHKPPSVIINLTPRQQATLLNLFIDSRRLACRNH